MVKNISDWQSLLSHHEVKESNWVVLTPERVAMISLIDCEEQLVKSGSDPLRLSLAAKSAHLALQAALTAALAGTANIGAHPEKLRVEYLNYLNDPDISNTARPISDRVMGFGELLELAKIGNLPWSNVPLAVDDNQQELLDRLTSLRHDIEHPKQNVHSIEPEFILQTLPVAARLTIELLETVFHHFESGEMGRLKKVADAIVAIVNDAG